MGRNDRVLMVVPTSAEFVFVYHAALSLGAIAVTVNPLSTAREIEYFLTDSESALAVGDSDSEAALLVAAKAVDAFLRGCWNLERSRQNPSQNDDECAVYEDVRESDAAALLYTSGTTGRPKGAVPPTATCSIRQGSIGGARDRAGRPHGHRAAALPRLWSGFGDGRGATRGGKPLAPASIRRGRDVGACGVPSPDGSGGRPNHVEWNAPRRDDPRCR